MSVHTKVDEEGIYFVTFTCYNCLPLIEASHSHDAVYNFFEALAKQSHSILAYVVMPNHLHLLLHYSGGSKSLNTVIGNGKRFMAYDIVSRLEQKGEKELLKKMEKGVEPKDRSRGKKHEVWEGGFDVKECRTEDFILQKLIYIHENPVRGKWKLSETSLTYEHSSALFYFNGKQRLFAVKDYRDFVKWEEMYD